MSKQTEKDNKTFHVVKKHDDTIEVAIRKNPARTWLGKFVAAFVLIGMVGLLIAGAIFAIVSNS